jgi:putative transcriptional regulator
MSEPPNLSGKILLAHPHLHDPNFRRSIIYLAKHDPETGAFGFIINRPTTQTCETLQIPGMCSLFGDAPLYLGGPVGGDNLILVTLHWDAFLKKLSIEYTTEPANADPLHTIAIVGYAGWSAGQLEHEIGEKAWLIQDLAATGHLLLQADTSTWKTLIAQIHPHLRLLAEMPDNVGLN